MVVKIQKIKLLHIIHYSRTCTHCGTPKGWLEGLEGGWVGLSVGGGGKAYNCGPAGQGEGSEGGREREGGLERVLRIAGGSGGALSV